MEIEGVFKLVEKNTSHMSQEYAELSVLYDAQPALTRHFLDQQAAAIVSALGQEKGRIRYQLPDRIALEGGKVVELSPAMRWQTIGTPLKRYSHFEKCTELIRHLNTLEQGFDPDLAVCGKLFRFALVRTIVYHLLPDGHNVKYKPLLGDDIPSIPVGDGQASALLAATDAGADLEDTNQDGDRLQVPYVAAARRFYLPQWVAFGEQDCLLTDSLAKAETCIASLENAMRLLQEAVAICPSVVADETYQRKRTGLLGQLVNQGRALARYEIGEMIRRIKQRASEGSLNRGLSLDIPYFDDQALEIKNYQLEVIPVGLIMFVPAFVVLAVQREYVRIIQDTRLNSSTRKHLLSLLATLEKAFRIKKDFKSL